MSASKNTITSLVPDMTGHTICDGRIRMLEKIGEGGYGVVYRAEHIPCIPISNPKQFAVKVLVKAEPNTRQWTLQRRELGAHTVVRDQPNVLSLHGYTEDDWFIYVVLDYCPGGDLFHKICDGHTFAGNDALAKKVFVQILDGVQSCHEMGIFHRDLKPDNILITNDEMDIVIADFGLATNALTSETFACGSSFYISPECIGEEFRYRSYSTAKSDIWALGVILVNIIAGRNPWAYATTSDQNFLRYLANPEYLREMLPISRAACALLQRIFTFDTKARISIPEIREAILAMDTFFMSEEDIAKGPKLVKVAAKTYANTDAAARYSPIDTSGDAYRRSILHAVLIEDRTNHFVVVSSFGTHASQYDSGSDSDGPITPATYAQNPDIKVPDFDEVQGLGIPMIVEPILVQKVVPAPIVIVRDVVQIIM